MYPDPRRRHPRFELSGSAGAGPRHQSFCKFPSLGSAMPSNHLILCPPFFLLPSIFLSIRVFSNESVLCIRWPKYWNFSFNISPSNEHSGLISFRMDWLDLLEVQGTLLKILVSTCRSLSYTLAESPSGARNPPSLLILPGLLRSNWGGLSVSSPSGERKDACGLCKWCKLLVLKFYWSPV